MKKKKKRSFFPILLKTTILILLLITAGLISYYTVMMYWQPRDKKEKNAHQEDIRPVKVIPIDSDNVSKNMIFSYNKDTNEIQAAVLEVLCGDQRIITYLTLPLDTVLTMPSKLYQKMVVINPEIPQMMKLSVLPKYIDFQKSTEDALLILGGMFDIELNYYTSIPEDIFDEMFTAKVEQKDGNDPVIKYSLSTGYQNKLSQLKSEEEIKNYIKSEYDKILTNLTVEDKMSFSKFYKNIKSNQLNFELLDGVTQNSGYIIEEEIIHQQLKQICGR